MILRLIGADFSEKNIGKLSLINELSSDIKELLSHYSKILTESQKFAVQDFIQGLKDNDIWASIGNLYLPILAGNLNETLYNIKTKTVDSEPSELYYQLSNNGIKAIGGERVNVATMPLANASQQNLHLAAFNTDSYEGMSQTDTLFGYTNNDEINQVIQLGITSSLDLSLKTDNNTNISGGVYERSPNPGMRMIIQSTSGNLSVSGTKVGSFGTPISTDNPYSNVDVQLFNLTTQLRETYSHYGLLSMGTSMTQEQAQIYTDLSINLMSFFGVKKV